MATFFIYDPDSGEVHEAQGDDASDAAYSVKAIWAPLEGLAADFGKSGPFEVLVCPTRDFAAETTQVLILECKMSWDVSRSVERPSDPLLTDARACAAREPRAPGCACQWEDGDSPCPVHGLDEN